MPKHASPNLSGVKMFFFSDSVGQENNGMRQKQGREKHGQLVIS